MRVARLHGIGDVRVEDAPDPVVPEGHTLVRVSDVGLCGSDLHWFGEGGIGDATLTRPTIPGHEFAGVGASGELDGVPVAVDPAIPCGRCEMCEAGHRNLCLHIQFAGHSTLDGGMAELIAWPTHLLHPLPSGMTGADGAMLEPLGVALHAWDLAHARVGDTIAVVGCGPIGLLAIQLARAAGAGRVIAVEPRAHRREAAARHGADAVLDVDEAGEAATWRRWGIGADIVLEIAGTDAAIDIAVTAVRPGGRVVLAGIPDGERSSFGAHLARRKGLTFAMVRRMKEMYPRAIRLVEQGHVDVRSIVTERVPLDDVAGGFARATARTGLKTVIGLS
jgi:L-iditol 2-dehydrogenase